MMPLMSDTHHEATPPPPVWLVRITLGSVVLALLAGTAMLWAKWGVVLAMSQDFLKNCFG